MEVNTLFIDRKTQYFQGVESSQIDLYIQSNLNKNPIKLYYGINKLILKLVKCGKKTQNSQHNIEGEQSWKT